MAYLLDTSILGRLANTADSMHAIAARAVLELHSRGEMLHITPQNPVEFRNVATRPIAVNGLGLSSVEAEAKAAIFTRRPAKISCQNRHGIMKFAEADWHSPRS